jgi:hypothetical protein
LVKLDTRDVLRRSECRQPRLGFEGIVGSRDRRRQRILRGRDAVPVRRDLGLRLGELGAPLIHRQLERHRIDGGEQIALRNVLIVGDMYGDDAPGDLGRQRHEIGLDVGVAGIGDQ